MTVRDRRSWAGAVGVMAALLMKLACADDTLQEIVVTAEKRPENSQTVPITVTAMTGDTMLARGVTDMTDLSTVAPGLDYSLSLNSATPFLRGIGSQNTTAGEEPAVALYVDGVYRSALPGALFNFNNVDRVEVLSGPQGTLFGRNAVGGVINIITKDPGQTPSADIGVGYGNFNRVEGSFYGTTGITDKIAADLAVYYADQGRGFLTNLYDGQRVGKERDVNIRSKWVWDLDSATKIKLSIDYDDYTAPTGLWANTPKTKAFYNVDENFPGYGNATQYGVGFTVTHEFDWASFSSISSYRQVNSFLSLDFDLVSAPLLNITVANPDTAYTQEFQLASRQDSKIKWIAGFYYYNDKSGYDPLFEQGIVIPFPYYDEFAYEYAKSYAGYGQATAGLGRDTNLTLGYRYTDDIRSVIGYYYTEAAILPPNGAIPGAEGSQSKSFKDGTYRLALDHEFSGDVMGYVSFNTGFKSGLYNLETPTLAPVQPETLYAYEIGEKAQFLENRLRLNSAIFFYNFQHMQTSTESNGVVDLLNAAGAKVKGFEAQLEAIPVDHLAVQAAMSYLDATFSSFTNCPTYTAPSPINCTDNTLPHAPKWMFNAGAQYTVSSSVGAFLLSAGASYNGGFFWDPDNVLRQPSYTVASASAKWTSTDGRYDLRLWGKNLTSAKYYAFGTSQPFGEETSPAFPRTYGISAAVHLK